MQHYQSLPLNKQYSIALATIALIMFTIGLASLVTQGPTVPAAAATEVQQTKISYSFTQGSLITTPAADFCESFKCIANFWQGRGYVVECADGMYSLSGGIRDACSYHGGVLRPLYRKAITQARFPYSH